MKVFIVQGIHPTVPGDPTKVFASLADANKKAAELVAHILKDTPLDDAPTEVTADNWEAVLERLQDYHGAQFCNVWTIESDVHGAPPLLEHAIAAEEGIREAVRVMDLMGRGQAARDLAIYGNNLRAVIAQTKGTA